MAPDDKEEQVNPGLSRGFGDVTGSPAGRDLGPKDLLEYKQGMDTLRKGQSPHTLHIHSQNLTTVPTVSNLPDTLLDFSGALGQTLKILKRLSELMGNCVYI